MEESRWLRFDELAYAPGVPTKLQRFLRDLVPPLAARAGDREEREG